MKLHGVINFSVVVDEADFDPDEDIAAILEGEDPGELLDAAVIEDFGIVEVPE